MTKAGQFRAQRLIAIIINLAPGSATWDREPKLEQTTVTDGKGAFVVSASADTTLVVVKKTGFAATWKTWSSTIPDSTDPIVLTAPAALSGVVVDDNGQPVSDAEVWVVGANIGNGYDSESQLNEFFGGPAKSCFSARTGADGRFRIENFSINGRAGLGVRKAGLARHTVGNELGGERDFQPGQDLKLVVGPAGNVEGKVVAAETGQPLGGVKIKMDQFGAGVFGTDYYETVESRADGTFRVPDVQPGMHCIRAYISGGSIPDWVFVPEGSQIFTVTAGETTNVVVHFSKGALVEVKVVMTNKLTTDRQSDGIFRRISHSITETMEFRIRARADRHELVFRVQTRLVAAEYQSQDRIWPNQSRSDRDAPASAHHRHRA